MLILASESPRRRELLKRVYPEFEIRSADVTEISAGADLFSVPVQNAAAKAMKVAQAHPDALVLGADTVIIFDGKIIGKPRDIEDAKRILLGFSGREHSVVTGVALVRMGKNPVRVSYFEESKVKFKAIGENVVTGYLERVQVLDKAGAYAIQEHGNMIIEYYTGELENIIGLPLEKLATLINKYL